MNKRKLLIPIIVVFTLLWFGGCEKLKERLPEGFGGGRASGGEQMQQQEEEPETVFAVNTTTSIEGEIIDYIELTGEVVTKASVDVYADTMGKLSVLNIEVGSYVEKDQVIAEVDPSKPGMKFVASPVKSPIAGTVIEVPVHVGATITQQVPIAKISRTNEKQLRTYIAEKYISKMKYGLNALLYFAAFPDEVFRARVADISPIVDPQSRTLEVKLNFSSYDRRIKPGMFAEIKIITEQKSGIVKIPVECLVKRYGAYYVFVVRDDNTAERRNVTPGIQIDNKVEIVEGLGPDEKVVIRGQTLLADGSKIKVIDEVQPLESQDVIE